MSTTTYNRYGLINSVADLFNELTNEGTPFYNWSSRSNFSSNIEKTDKGYEARVDIPGYNKKTLNIKVENKDLLVVRSNKEGEDNKVLYRLQLGTDIDRMAITAKSEDGVLSLTLPESVEHKTKCIKIE
jgi:HSP20 family molecular chaperone IbpA